MEQTLEPLLIAEEQRAAFVGGETASEPDRQNFRIENPIHAPNRFGRFARALARRADALAHEFHQTQFQFLVRLPQLRIGNVGDAPPEIRLGQMFFPIAQILRIERGKFRRHPRFGVDAVGDTRDRHFVAGHTGPDIFPKRAAHFAV